MDKAACPHLLSRERRALTVAGPLGVGPPLLFANDEALVRGFIHGVALHVARPAEIADISSRPKPPCAACTAPASPTTILPRNKTGYAALTARPT